MADPLDAQAAVERFFDAFYSGDTEATRAAVTEDFKLEGPFATANTADELLQLAQGLMKLVRGYKVLNWMTDGDRVSVLYKIVLSGPAGREGLLTIGGWFTAVDGRLARGRVIYDSAEFDAIVEPG